MAVNETNKSIYLATEDSSNRSLWQIITNDDDDKIKLKNVQTQKFLNRKKWGLDINTYSNNNFPGNFWSLHGTILDSNQISLESYKNDFLYRGTDKYYIFF